MPINKEECCKNCFYLKMFNEAPLVEVGQCRNKDCPCHKLDHNSWEEKIRMDYKGIFLDEQIEKTITYWKDFIKKIILIVFGVVLAFFAGLLTILYKD